MSSTSNVSTLTIKIPENIFVVISAAEVDRYGWATAYEKNAAFKKRAMKLCSAAYSLTDITIDHDAEKVTLNPGSNSKVDMGNLFIEKRFPMIIENKLVEGFEVSKAVRRRAHWRSNDDVVWRIRDPRNFDIEISSGNFLRIIENTEIVNGRIKGNCIWAMDGSSLVLLPENSDLYREASSFTTKVSQNLTLRDIKPGDKIELLATAIKETPVEAEYYGRYSIIWNQVESGSAWSDDAVWGLASAQDYRHIVKYDSKFYAFRTFKVISLIDKLAIPKSKDKLAKEINDYMTAGKTIAGIDYTVLVSPTTVNLDNIVVSLTPDNTPYPKWNKSGYYTDQVIFEHNGERWCSELRGDRNNLVNSGYRLILNLSEKKKKNFLVQVKSTNYWNSSGYNSERVFADLTNINLKDLPKYRVTYTYNELTSQSRQNWR